LYSVSPHFRRTTMSLLTLWKEKSVYSLESARVGRRFVYFLCLANRDSDGGRRDTYSSCSIGRGLMGMNWKQRSAGSYVRTWGCCLHSCWVSFGKVLRLWCVNVFCRVWKIEAARLLRAWSRQKLVVGQEEASTPVYAYLWYSEETGLMRDGHSRRP
jgi:hypothetical protein